MAREAHRLRWHVDPLVEALKDGTKIDVVTPDDVERWKAERDARNTLSPEAFRRFLRVLRARSPETFANHPLRAQHEAAFQEIERELAADSPGDVE